MRRMQREDLYHIRKHRRRLRPDELTPEQIAESLRISGWVKLHRVLTWPYFRVRPVDLPTPQRRRRAIAVCRRGRINTFKPSNPSFLPHF